MFEELNQRRKAIAENIGNSFIEKARSGIYFDNEANRKLNRVGQTYGKHEEHNVKETTTKLTWLNRGRKVNGTAVYNSKSKKWVLSGKFEDDGTEVKKQEISEELYNILYNANKRK